MRKPRRATLVIDELNSGGAQRDLVRLASGLTAAGYDATVLTYWPGDFFASALAEAGVAVERVRSRNRLHLIYAMRRAIRRSRPDVVLSFLRGANVLAELAGAPRRTFAVIAMELNLDTQPNSARRRARYALHRLADAVVSNSHAQRERMLEIAPFLADKTSVIVNGVDLRAFAPPPSPPPARAGQLRLLALARLQPQKNPFALLEALDILRREEPALDVAVDWHGDRIAASDRKGAKWARSRRRGHTEYAERFEQEVARLGLQDRFRLRPAAQDVLPLYHAADALVLPSVYEGTPNAVCEAMACGLPVLASRVGDNPRLVEDGRTGFLFDPNSPADAADSIRRFAALPAEARNAMRAESRARAEASLSADEFNARYVDLIERTLRKREGGARGGRERDETGADAAELDPGAR